ncbi:Cytochrome P450 94C1 [Carex littledalei]|uniref:Cytochrome P450 94C1 n=1 Tax=Carex littledalei TaxID=544730 RepID=A0A833QYM0_9POAL|nr:Cytochrome P450 94C1 [Carex littledalei]
MGRLEDIWGKDCMEFKTERWIDENGVFKPESPFRYPIFHAGPRMCLGKEMAYIKMKSIVIRALREGIIEHTFFYSQDEGWFTCSAHNERKLVDRH